MLCNVNDYILAIFWDMHTYGIVNAHNIFHIMFYIYKYILCMNHPEYIRIYKYVLTQMGPYRC